MPRIADFSRTTVNALEKRVANRCSFPGCKALTSGPSAESESAVSNTGTACHIYAASDGPAARRVKNISTVQLKNISNGIWMCATHGRLIDTDESTYSPDNLIEWRRIAERKASLMQAFGEEGIHKYLKEELLASIDIRASYSDITTKVRQFMIESCILTLWGENASHELRNFIIEIARNSFKHGNASEFQISSSGHSITMRSDGVIFSISDLNTSENGRGGFKALSELKKLPENIIVSHQVVDGKNEVTVSILQTKPSISLSNPCSVSFETDRGDKSATIKKLDQLTSCDRIFIFAPDYCLSYSDVFDWKDELETRAAAGQKICLVIDVHSDSLMRLLKKEMPNVEVLVLDP